jgi:hypothetical protein
MGNGVMSELHSPAKECREHTQSALKSIVNYQDDARQESTDYRTLYVLGFGIVGAILNTMSVLIYFASLHASG